MDLLRLCSNVLWVWCAVWTLAEGFVGNLTIGGMARGSLDRQESRVYTLTVNEDYGDHPVSSGAGCRARTPEQGAVYLVEILGCTCSSSDSFLWFFERLPLYRIVCSVQFCGLSFIAHIFVCVALV